MRHLRIIALLLTTALLSGCETPWSTPQIAVVDLQSVAKSLGRDEKIASAINTANARLNQQIETLSAELRKNIDEKKAALGDKPEKEDEQAYIQLIQKSNAKLNQVRQLAAQKSQQVKTLLIIEFRKEASDAAASLAKTLKFKAVLGLHDGLLWSENTLDITDKVTAVMMKSKK